MIFFYKRLTTVQHREFSAVSFLQVDRLTLGNTSQQKSYARLFQWRTYRLLNILFPQAYFILKFFNFTQLIFSFTFNLLQSELFCETFVRNCRIVLFYIGLVWQYRIIQTSQIKHSMGLKSFQFYRSFFQAF